MYAMRFLSIFPVFLLAAFLFCFLPWWGVWWQEQARTRLRPQAQTHVEKPAAFPSRWWTLEGALPAAYFCLLINPRLCSPSGSLFRLMAS